MTVAAVQVEMLWNKLAMTREFSLLCGYGMGNFYKDAALQEICDQHSHVVSAEGRRGAREPRAAQSQLGFFQPTLHDTHVHLCDTRPAPR